MPCYNTSGAYLSASTAEVLNNVDTSLNRGLGGIKLKVGQSDAPRMGGITPFLKIAALADLNRLKLAPHFAMEVHIHLACAYPHEVWVEHIEWPEPAFNERLAAARF